MEICQISRIDYVLSGNGLFIGRRKLQKKKKKKKKGKAKPKFNNLGTE
jgi:hypothetical protein